MTETGMEQTIIETAERLFVERGYVLTSTTDIAREVGCNQSLINYYFRSKEKLFQAIFEKNVIIFFSLVKEPLEKNIPFLEKIRILAESHFQVLQQHKKVPFFVLNEIGTNPKQMEAVKSIAKQSLHAIIPVLEQELAIEIAEGRVRNMTLFDILLSMASLNLGVFLLPPILENIMDLGDADVWSLLQQRGKENARILVKSLLPRGNNYEEPNP